LTAVDATIWERVLRNPPGSRIASLTGLDCIGVPVVSLTRPLSRGISTTQGKGLTFDQACLSAVMEGVEHAAAECIDFGRAVMRKTPARPETKVDFDLAACLRADQAIAHLRPDMPWLPAFNIGRGVPAMVPWELVAYDTSTDRPYSSGLIQQSTDGLAAGFDRDFAIAHGLAELIERDASALAEIAGNRFLASRRQDIGVFRSDTFVQLRERLDSASVALRLFDITSDTGVPAYDARICDKMWRGRRGIPFRAITSGTGAHADPEQAASRAVLEAIQTRLTVIGGARDDHTAEEYSRNAPRALVQLMFGALACALKLASRHAKPPVREAPAALVSWMLQRLRAVGIRNVYVVDLPCCLDGVHAVRVIVPELLPPQGDPISRMGMRGLRALVGAA
jgi:YcaO-like protein with predicted kinase domain